ncbi:hypothetical protein RhiirC2_859053 [Rhizophagus irregularis]|uniref:Uncharacterized protein n=1 Tax=Rhizophagus irregularis TaxID=588596 RepID=A0A2N1M141_9GLOM|nr:hypothetical protein RhiirC2_859053 [Rhizophagus irregularis]
MWTDRQLRILINERKNKNDNFHELSGNMKHNFWKGLKMQLYIDGQPKGRKSTLGAKYYKEFSQRFWEK